MFIIDHQRSKRILILQPLYQHKKK